MIKFLKNKFFICLFILVTVFSVTSSCLAVTLTESNIQIVSLSDFGITMDDVISYIQINSTTDYNFPDDFSHGVFADYVSNEKIRFMFYRTNYSYFDYLVYDAPGSFRRIIGYDNNDTIVESYIFATCTYNTTSSLFSDCRVGAGGSTAGFSNYSGTTGVLKVVDCTTFNIYLNGPNGDLVYTPNRLSIDVTHEFQNDTSAKVNFAINNAPEGAYLEYSLTGVEINADLNAPIKLRNPIRYSQGVTNLVVKENTKVYWALYDADGNCLDTNVYQVPESDIVVENSDKDIEYTISYNADNTLATLTVNVINGEFSDKLYYTENGMISNDFAGKILFPASRSLEINHNCSMHVVLYDYFGNLITGEYITINKIGLIPESNFKVDVTTADKTVFLRPRLYNILQSRFYTIEYDVILDTFTASSNIDLFQNGSYVADVTNTLKTYTCGSDSELKFFQNIGTSNITVTFRVLNAETGETCITRTVSFKIGLDDESTGVTGSTTNGVTDNSFITSGTDSNYSDVANMGINDYYNLVNTNNTAWNFFKVILDSLPNWITLPLSLLIFGVVIITLYRFIRGA